MLFRRARKAASSLTDDDVAAQVGAATSAVPPGYRDVPPTVFDPEAPVDPAEAEEFLLQCYGEQPQLGDVHQRLAQVRREIADTGSYVHTSAELTHGARMAWRNASKCVGRLYWRSLTVRDCRSAITAADVFGQVVGHLRTANGGRGSRAGRPVMSVFSPAGPGRTPPRIWNEQLVRYAAYGDGDYTVGDPQYAQFTEAVSRLGWRGTGDRFDVLPLVIETVQEGPRLYELPREVVLEVRLTHPDYHWFADLGLRWHAIPAISHMRLNVGGVNYPLAPFSGWYVETEVGTRNLADPHRFDLAPTVAEWLGLDTSTEETLWRDRAVLELNRAVLHSFRAAGVRISDHHTEARRFLAHIDREQRQGRVTPADWTWIVGAVGTSTAAFHRYYQELDLRPNLYLDDSARRLARTGQPHPETSAATAAGVNGHHGCPVNAGAAHAPAQRVSTEAL